MRYLNAKHLEAIGINWQETIDVIEHSVKDIAKGDFSQPIKPYLQYGDICNRIIAMPAYIGGSADMAGIKWIASFPKNSEKNLPRAHSVLLLNDSQTGVPKAIINTALLSVIRTASVTGLIMRYFAKARTLNKVNIGIIGWGPIGQFHLKMCQAIYGEKINKVYLYDINTIAIDAIESTYKDKIVVVERWQDAYQDADIFITCTVSKAPYINIKPKAGSLQLNVSLRDYTTDIFDTVKDTIIVDNWEEICRANTDIENFHNQKGLQKEQTKSIIDVVVHDCLKQYSASDVVMFNPMGMACFDVAIGSYYFKKSERLDCGTRLDD